MGGMSRATEGQAASGHVHGSSFAAVGGLQRGRRETGSVQADHAAALPGQRVVDDDAPAFGVHAPGQGLQVVRQGRGDDLMRPLM